jgi:glutathione S-transferase
MSVSIELISHPLCPYVHRAAALLTEYGVPHEVRFIDLQAKPTWFLAISPRGKVPVLIVDGEPIFESNVILEYLAERFAPDLLLADPLARAHRRMWMELSNDLMASNYKMAVAGSQRERQAALVEARGALARFEPLLAPGPFAGGARPGLVDFAAGPALLRFEKLRAELGLDAYEGLPRIAAWSKAIVARPAFTDSLVADFDARFHAFVKHDLAA